MKNTGNHIVEYYQKNKFLGHFVYDGVLPQNEIGYSNRGKMTEGTVQFKKKHTATLENPIMFMKYNQQGR
jgi:hypothetical protein